MKRDELDRIVVNSNAKMDKVINWYYQNKEWLDSQSFKSPFKRGMVILEEERIEFTFEQKEADVFEIEIYMWSEKSKAKIVGFDYNPDSELIFNSKINIEDEARKNILMLTLATDNTLWKEAVKFKVLMMFASYYEGEHIKSNPSLDKKRSKTQAKKYSRSDRTISLVRKTYEIEDFEKVKRPDGKRGYTKCEHEFDVRGFWRHYKSGKVVWVDGYTRNKGKGDKKGKNYRL